MAATRAMTLGCLPCTVSGETGKLNRHKRYRLSGRHRYANWALLVIDEFGLDQIEREECPKAAHLLYKVIVSRHHKRSTILITNIDFDAWASYLGDAPLATAMLDRLVDGAVVIKIKGPSYRASRVGTPLAEPTR